MLDRRVFAAGLACAAVGALIPALAVEGTIHPAYAEAIERQGLAVWAPFEVTAGYIPLCLSGDTSKGFCAAFEANPTARDVEVFEDHIKRMVPHLRAFVLET